MEKPETILVVDDSADTVEMLRRNLASRGFAVLTATSVTQAVKVLETAQVGLVVTDIKMPDIDGFSLMRHIRENYKAIAVLAITGFPTIDGAIRAMKTGAEEYLIKPFTDEELFSAVDRSLRRLRLTQRTHTRTIMPERCGLVGESPAMMAVFDAIARAASSTATVLIQGESGTGKELIARAIHYNSARARFPFVAVNCGGIPESLFESELFGYVKGAFSGATSTRAGFFQTADRGTILLDEISEASLAMQVKLLRVLQEREISLLGSSKPIKVDVRITAATNRDLYDHTLKGLFREDLFYRLNVITVSAPPLRERQEDIPLLAEHLLGVISEKYDRRPPRFSEEALEVMRQYSWPGNVRELENLIHRLTAMCTSDIIEIPDLPPSMRFSATCNSGLSRTLSQVEAEYVRDVLASVGGNKSTAAKILGVDRKTLREKLRKTGD
ncbi:MAG: sigma-54 dependent transcriptional regulator [Desulfobacteraceae bacterium]|nr:sigma-54 dependent transcriptional regulator [Desulfobacteraceae bacterium]